MRTPFITAIVLVSFAVPAGVDARSLPKPGHLDMKDARSVALMQASDLASALNESTIPVGHASGIGRCERLTDSRVRCRMVARGTWEECRGWSYSRSTDDPDTIVGWLRHLRCEPVSG